MGLAYKSYCHAGIAVLYVLIVITVFSNLLFCFNIHVCNIHVCCRLHHE